MIHNVLSSIKIGSATGAMWLIGQVAPAPPLMTATDWHITIATASSVVVFSGLLVWNLGRKIQRLEDGQSHRQKQIDELSRAMREDAIEMRTLIRGLPCQHPAKCPDGNSKVR